MPANLRQLLDPQTAHPFPDALDASLTRPQAAAFLGVSESYLKKLDLEGRGPAAYRLGRRWTYLKRDLLAWREAFRVEGLLATLPPPPTPAAPPAGEAAPPLRRRGRPRKSPVVGEVA